MAIHLADAGVDVALQRQAVLCENRSPDLGHAPQPFCHVNQLQGEVLPPDSLEQHQLVDQMAKMRSLLDDRRSEIADRVGHISRQRFDQELRIAANQGQRRSKLVGDVLKDLLAHGQGFFQLRIEMGVCQGHTQVFGQRLQHGHVGVVKRIKLVL